MCYFKATSVTQELLENDPCDDEVEARRHRELTDKYLAGELNFSSFVKEMKYHEGDRGSDDDSDKVGRADSKYSSTASTAAQQVPEIGSRL